MLRDVFCCLTLALHHLHGWDWCNWWSPLQWGNQCWSRNSTHANGTLESAWWVWPTWKGTNNLAMSSGLGYWSVCWLLASQHHDCKVFWKCARNSQCTCLYNGLPEIWSTYTYVHLLSETDEVNGEWWQILTFIHGEGDGLRLSEWVIFTMLWPHLFF